MDRQPYRGFRRQNAPKPIASLDQALAEMKPVWRNRNARAFGFFCPNCRAERKVKTHPSPSQSINYVRIALLTAVFTVGCWPWFGVKGLVSFVPFWAGFEVIFRSRMRVALQCPHCGFDPFVYLSDVQRARSDVEAHWRKICAAKGIPYRGLKPADDSEPAVEAADETEKSTPPFP